MLAKKHSPNLNKVVANFAVLERVEFWGIFYFLCLALLQKLTKYMTWDKILSHIII